MVLCRNGAGTVQEQGVGVGVGVGVQALIEGGAVWGSGALAFSLMHGSPGRPSRPLSYNMRPHSSATML
jgi:hypothetical protein